MRLQKIQFLGLSITVLFLLITVLPSESFATSVTYEDLTSPITINFRNTADKGSIDDVEDAVITLDKESYLKGDIAFLNITNANANVSPMADFIFATVLASSQSLTETDTSSGLFSTSFKVGRNANVDYEPDSKSAARAKITIPSGFSGDLEFSDVIEDANQIDGECIKPVTGTLKITGNLNVQPTIRISYANANFTGVDSQHLETRMYYRAPDQQAEPITLSYLENGNKLTYLSLSGKTIRSQNGGAVLNPGGWVPTPTNYAGQYFLGQSDQSCGGGGGGGLVRPSLVVNALAGVGGFAGSADGSPPMIELSELVKYTHLGIPLEIEQMVLNHDSTIPITPMEIGLFGGFDYPLTINDKGFVLGGFSNTIETQTIKTNSTATIKFILYETTKIQHISLYTNLRDANTQIHQSDTQVLYNDGLVLQIKDPNGFFSDVSVTINEINENKKEAVFEITFAKEMDTSDMIVRAWDPYFSSLDTIILDAIKVVPEIVVESPTPTFDEPEIQELKSQSIPIWIKNNAAWWSEQQIEDSDFVAGIEYLIKNKIINVPGVQVGTSSTTEIPDWIKNNAAWWSDSLITDGDFVEAMQWLVANGVIQI